MNKTKNASIEKINMLGPWVHGFFNLPNGITIQDTDIYQKQRLIYLRDQFVKIIQNHYSQNILDEKEILDIGCNAGYFLFELFNYFKFKTAKGIDPKKSNIDKAKFIAKSFKLLSDTYKTSIGNLFDIKEKKQYNIVIMPGVLHHLDDHIMACKKLYDITSEILILETMVLPDEVESKLMAEFLELKDDVYKKGETIFGVTGHKFESEYLDGATASSGIVSIPSKNSVYLSLFNAGFRDIELIDIKFPFELIESNKSPKYRNFRSIIAIAKKPKITNEIESFFKDKINDNQNDEIDILIPMDVIQPLFKLINGSSKVSDERSEADIIYLFLLKNEENSFTESLKNRPYYKILSGFLHSPLDKISVEYAKTLINSNEKIIAKKILRSVILTANCDWRSVYKAYHLLSIVSLSEKNILMATNYNNKALRTFPKFFPAIKLREEIKKMKKINI